MTSVAASALEVLDEHAGDVGRSGHPDRVDTVLVPPLLCSPGVYAPVLDTVWSYGAVTVADTRHDVSIPAMARRLLDTAPDRFALLGTSMGGYVAMEVVRQAPDRVLGLALVSTSARADSVEQIAARQTQSRMVRDGHFPTLVDAAFPGVVAARHERDPELLRTWRSMANTVGQDGFLRQQEACSGRRDSRELLTEISCPTFVVHGEEDRLIDPSAARETAASIPRATLRMVERAGHFLVVEQPAAARAVVDEFLRTVRLTASSRDHPDA